MLTNESKKWSTSFIDAVKKSDIPSIQNLLKSPNASYQTALNEMTFHIKYKYITDSKVIDEILEMLFQKGSFTDEQLKEIGMALLRTGHLPILQRCLKSNNWSWLPNQWRRIVSIVLGNIDAIKETVWDSKSDIHAIQNIALIGACCYNQVNVVEALLKDGNTDYDTRRRAFEYTCAQGHLAVIKQLLEDGSFAPSFLYFSKQNHIDKTNAINSGFYEACINNHSNIVLHLLSASRCHLSPSNLKTAFHRACVCNRQGVVEVLLREIDIKSDFTVYRNALNAATKEGHSNVVKTLLEKFTLPELISLYVLTINEEDKKELLLDNIKHHISKLASTDTTGKVYEQIFEKLESQPENVRLELELYYRLELANTYLNPVLAENLENIKVNPITQEDKAYKKQILEAFKQVLEISKSNSRYTEAAQLGILQTLREYAAKQFAAESLEFYDHLLTECKIHLINKGSALTDGVRASLKTTFERYFSKKYIGKTVEQSLKKPEISNIFKTKKEGLKTQNPAIIHSKAIPQKQAKSNSSNTSTQKKKEGKPRWK